MQRVSKEQEEKEKEEGEGKKKSRKRKGEKGKRGKEKEEKKRRRRRDSRRWLRAEYGVDEKRRARGTRRTGESLNDDGFRCWDGDWVWCQGDESPEKIR